MLHTIESVRGVIADVLGMRDISLDWDVPLGEQVDLDEYEDDICDALTIECEAEVTPEMLRFETITLRDSAETIIEYLSE